MEFRKRAFTLDSHSIHTYKEIPRGLETHKNAHAYPSGHESTSIYCRSLHHAVRVLVKVEAHCLPVALLREGNGLDGILVHQACIRVDVFGPRTSGFHSSHLMRDAISMPSACKQLLLFSPDEGCNQHASSFHSSHRLVFAVGDVLVHARHRVLGTRPACILVLDRLGEAPG